MTGTVLVTGASGFVGRCLVPELVRRGHGVRALVRGRIPQFDPHLGVEVLAIGDIDAERDWCPLLRGATAVVHLAAVAHREDGPTAAFREELERTNVMGTRTFATACARAGVERFVFVSSVGVNGRRTTGAPFTEADAPRPHDEYSRSKLRAEEFLREMGDLPLTILRPTLIYGRDAPGNLARLIALLRKRAPLPLAGIRNQRSYLYVGNLASLLVCCLEREEARGEVFLAADGQDLSTPDLVRRIARILGIRPWLFRVPVSLLRAAARPLGRLRDIERLCDSLQVSTAKATSRLGWAPPATVDEGLRLSFCEPDRSGPVDR